MINYKLDYQLFSFILVISSFVICAQSDVPRPRGVSLTKASLYSPTKDFTCFDGSATIPFTYVNDDYCDCFDGSDEPGTSACTNGVFHCTNAGHRSQNIPSSRVNDGICDCCDGTDEYIILDTCSDTCEELGKEARAEAVRMAELLKAGSQIRLELIEKGNKKRNEMADQLAQLEKDKTDAENIKNEKEALKDDIEVKENEVLKVYREAEEKERQKKAEEEKAVTRKEASYQFSKFDSDNNGDLTVAEIQAVTLFDRNRDGQVDEDEVKYYLNDQESVDLETFISTTWPLLKPAIMMNQGMFKPPADADHEELDHGDDEEEGDIDADEQNADDEAGDIEHLDDDQQQDEPEETVQSNTYDEETQKIVDAATDARKQHTEAERTVREIESNIKNIKLNLEKDYGLQQEYATLDGQCFEYEDKEYVYKLCMFQTVTQKSKNGGSEVGLGNWGEWAGGDYPYSAMKYTNGLGCWNGPNRMTTVNINCGMETKILSVSEPFRCEYKIELTTPAACDDSKPQHASHDEL